MRILFDENTPFSLARDLIGYECSHVIRLGWRGTKNGALLGRAERAGYSVLITIDDDIEPEQNMRGRKIAILVVKPGRQGKTAMRAMASHVLVALSTIKEGEIRIVDGTSEL